MAGRFRRLCCKSRSLFSVSPSPPVCPQVHLCNGLAPAASPRLYHGLPWDIANRIAPSSSITQIATTRRLHFRHPWLLLSKHLSSSVPSEADNPEGEHKDFRTLSFREFMSSVGTAPMVPMVLGVAGAIPFLVLTPPFPYWLPLPEVLSAHPIEAQTLYAAVILSFLGAPHWGLAMVGIRASPRNKVFNFAINTLRYIWSVVPTLLAWPALLLSTVPRLQLLICSFGLALAVDIFFAGHGLTPPWYLPLRMLLSGIVILCLMTSLIEVFLIQKLKAQEHSSKGES